MTGACIVGRDAWMCSVAPSDAQTELVMCSAAPSDGQVRSISRVGILQVWRGALVWRSCGSVVVHYDDAEVGGTFLLTNGADAGLIIDHLAIVIQQINNFDQHTLAFDSAHDI